MREHVQPLVDTFLINNEIADIPYYICGSYRRGKPECGDIELVFNPKTIEEINRTLLAIAKIFGYCLNGNIKMQGLWGEVQFDLFIADDSTLGATLLHTTGNGLFNILMRKQAQLFGLKLNQYGLWRGEVRVVAGPDEERFFRYLSLTYVKPEERST